MVEIIAIVLKTQFVNLNMNQLLLQLNALEEDIKVDKNHELVRCKTNHEATIFQSVKTI